VVASSLLRGTLRGHRRRSPLRADAVSFMNTPIPAVGAKVAIVGICWRRSFVPAVVVSGIALPVSGILPSAVPEVVVTVTVDGEEQTTNNTVISHGEIEDDEPEPSMRALPQRAGLGPERLAIGYRGDDPFVMAGRKELFL
jgi:hypothetical protein